MPNGSSLIAPHQHSAGAASDDDEAIGKSPAGDTGKIHLAVDGYELPFAFRLTEDEVHGSQEAAALIVDLPSGEALVTDKGYDSDTIRQQNNAQKRRPVILRKFNSIKRNASLDRGLYGYRHLVENAFARMKQYRAITRRYGKLKRN